MEKKQILKHFQESAPFNAKQFDSICLEAHTYAKENGFDENELELIVDYTLQQKLSSRRISYLTKMLIPVTYMPDTVVRSILKWLLQNYFKEPGKEAVKAIFQWLIGLLENKLTESDVIDLYYDFYYWFLDDPLPAKLIYLLTKPEDVKRWNVKRVLKLNEKFRSKHTGAILYLYKTYRPDLVPENIPAYAAQTVFPKIPAHFIRGFDNARKRIETRVDIPTPTDRINWERTDRYKHKSLDIILIPRTLIVDDNLNLNTNISSLRQVRSIQDLQKYMLGNNSLDNMYLMPLLNNAAGRFILTMAETKIHTTLSHMIYHILHDGFYNPQIKYEEMNHFLKCISSLQSENHECFPIITKALARYMTTWDGDDHFDEICSLLQFIRVSSFEDLHEYFLAPLKLLFATATLYRKCDILNTLGNMLLNTVILRSADGTFVTPLIFPDQTIEFNYPDMVTNLVEFIKDLCYIGLYLEENSSLLLHCITNLFLKVIAAEHDNIRLTIPDDLLYYALFTCSPSNIVQTLKISQRYKNSVSSEVIADYNCLYSNKMETISLVEQFSMNERRVMDNFGVTIKHFILTSYINFSCYIIPCKMNNDNRPGLKEILNVLSKLNSKEDREKRMKTLKLRNYL